MTAASSPFFTSSRRSAIPGKSSTCNGSGSSRGHICYAESGRSFRDCNPQQRRPINSRLELSILQRSRHEKEFARAKIDIGTAHRSGQTASDGELSGRRDFARRIEVPFLDFEKAVLNENFATLFN